MEGTYREAGRQREGGTEAEGEAGKERMQGEGGRDMGTGNGGRAGMVTSYLGSCNFARRQGMGKVRQAGKRQRSRDYEVG